MRVDVVQDGYPVGLSQVHQTVCAKWVRAGTLLQPDDSDWIRPPGHRPVPIGPAVLDTVRSCRRKDHGDRCDEGNRKSTTATVPTTQSWRSIALARSTCLPRSSGNSK